MHYYLKAIGFGRIKRKRELEELLQEIVMKHDEVRTAEDSDGNEFVTIMRKFNDQFGIVVCGEYQENEHFSIDYFYPVFWGKGITTNELIEIERHTDHESYAGICDEIRLGVTLIFYLQNVADYLNHRSGQGKLIQNVSTTLSALSLGGKVILPIGKNEKQLQNIEKNNRNRTHLIAAAREGDEEAIESLTLEDMDIYSMISRRVADEDILSIVESTFMPYGIESDQYSILGEILDTNLIKNNQTGEESYILRVNANELIFDVCINREDLLGEPLPGRRFKGNIWMQGRLNYQD